MGASGAERDGCLTTCHHRSSRVQVGAALDRQHSIIGAQVVSTCTPVLKQQLLVSEKGPYSSNGDGNPWRQVRIAKSIFEPVSIKSVIQQ